MATPFPGLDVTEEPFNGSMRRLFAQDPGPGNPRVPTGGMSFEGQKVSQGLRAPAAPVATPAAPAPFRAGQAVRSGLRGLVSAPSIAAGAGIQAASEGLSVPTENYRRRLGMDPNESSLGGDLAARGVGVVSDMGANILDLGLKPVNAIRQAAGAEPLETFGSILRRNDGPTATRATNVPSRPIGLRTLQPSNPIALPPPGAGLRDTGGAGNVSTVPGFDFGQAARISATNQGVIDAARALDIAQGHAPGIAGINGDGDRVAKAADFQQRADLRNRMMSARDPRTQQVLGQQLSDLNQMKTEGLRVKSSENIAKAHDDTQRYGIDTQAQTQRTGLRAQQGQHEAQLKSDMFKTMLEQQNKTRDFGLRAGEFDQRQQDSNLAAKNSAEEGFRKSMESRFRAQDAEGKDVADTAKIGEFSQFVDAGLSRALQQAMESGNPKQIAAAQALAARGKDGLDPQTMNYNMAAFKLKDRIRQAHGALPGSAKFVDDPDPAGYEVVKIDRRFGGDRAITRNGSEFNLSDVAYEGGPSNAALPDVGRRGTRDFEPMLRAVSGELKDNKGLRQ